MNNSDTPQTQVARGPLSFRFVLGRRQVTVSIPAPVLALLFLSLLCGYALGSLRAGTEQRRQNEAVTMLREDNQRMAQELARKQRQLEETASLAEARCDELWDELTDRDAQLNRLWRIVGNEPQNGHGRLTLASRGGQQRAALSPQGRYGQLKAKLEQSGQELKELTVATREYQRGQLAELAKRTPSIEPCQGEMSSGYGYRLHPVYGYQKLHNGCDFTTDSGTPIYATASGKVVSADWLGGYGQAVEIEHGRGLKTLYAHCEELKVRKGQQVRKGQLIATVGMTGLASGPHCHYEVHKDGKPINPARFLPHRTVAAK